MKWWQKLFGRVQTVSEFHQEQLRRFRSKDEVGTVRLMRADGQIKAPHKLTPKPRLFLNAKRTAWICTSSHISDHPDPAAQFSRTAFGYTPSQAYEKWKNT